MPLRAELLLIELYRIEIAGRRCQRGCEVLLIELYRIEIVFGIIADLGTKLLIELYRIEILISHTGIIKSSHF